MKYTHNVLAMPLSPVTNYVWCEPPEICYRKAPARVRAYEVTWETRDKGMVGIRDDETTIGRTTSRAIPDNSVCIYSKIRLVVPDIAGRKGIKKKAGRAGRGWDCLRFKIVVELTVWRELKDDGGRK